MKDQSNRTLTLSLGLAFALSVVATTSAAENPYAKPEGSFISLSGQVASTAAESFLLDYGEGVITVEMDDWDWYAETYPIIENDDVTVYGYVDDDFFETASIEASSVYVEDLNTYYYASGADEESTSVITATLYDFDYEVTGYVTSIDGREFTVDTGDRKVSVDTWQLGYNPLDDQGFLKLEKGDRVTVFGDLDLSLFDEREISAESIIKLESDVGKGAASSS